MPTTSREIAQRAIGGLVDTNQEFALLTRMSAIPEGSSSDVDLVVGASPPSVVAAASPRWAVDGLRPIMLWTYDASRSASVFLTNSDASEGVQLDLLYDPSGRHGYRVDSSALLRRVIGVEGVPHVDEIGRLIYLWQKRRRKRQSAEINRVLLQARTLDLDQVREAELEIVGTTSLADASAVRSQVPLFRARRTPADIPRIARRIARPIGFWVHTDAEGVALALRDRFARVVVSARCEEAPGGRLTFPFWYARNVLPAMSRPQGFFSWGDGIEARGPRPFLAVEGSVETAAAKTVEALAERMAQCVS